MFADQLQKTKMCRFHPLGKCTKGTSCPYAHARSDLKNQPDLRCTKLCKTLLQTGVCNDRKNCCYAHNKEELRSAEAFQKTKLCRNLQFGRCSRGDKCHFAHSTSELKTTEPVGVLKLPPGLGFEDDDAVTSYTSGELSGSVDSVDSGSDGGGDMQTSKKNDLAYEPAYVNISSIGSDLENFRGVFSNPATHSKTGLGEYAYSGGTDFEYLQGLAEWQGKWAIDPMSVVQEDYTEAFGGFDLNGFNNWDWNSVDDKTFYQMQEFARAMKASKLIIGAAPDA